MKVDEATDGVRPAATRSVRIAVAVSAAVAFLIVGGPLAALTSAAVSAIALVLQRTRVGLVLAAGIASVGWAAVSGLIIALEWRNDYANGPDWPLRFTWAAPVSWIVVAAITTQVLLSVISAHRPASPVPASDAG